MYCLKRKSDFPLFVMQRVLDDSTHLRLEGGALPLRKFNLKGTFFRLKLYKIGVGISQVEVYEKVGKSLSFIFF